MNGFNGFNGIEIASQYLNPTGMDFFNLLLGSAPFLLMNALLVWAIFKNNTMFKQSEKDK